MELAEVLESFKKYAEIISSSYKIDGEDRMKHLFAPSFVLSTRNYTKILNPPVPILVASHKTISIYLYEMTSIVFAIKKLQMEETRKKRIK